MLLLLIRAMSAGVNKIRLILLPVLFLSSGLYPVNAFDGSDIEIPRIEQMMLANTIPVKPSEPVAIILKTSDDKNWVKLEGTLNIGFSYRLIPGRNTPPNCSTVTTSFSKLEAIEIASERSTTVAGRRNQTFWLVGYLPAKKDLVSNCIEYRDFNQSPIVVLNANGFRSITPRGSNISIITGGVYTPKLVDESGRAAQSTLTTRVQEFQFLPGTYTYPPTQFCLSHNESVFFREKNKNALSQLDSEVVTARDLGNPEGVELSALALQEMKQIDSWGAFSLSPSLNSLKAIPACASPNSSNNLLKVLNDLRLKIKTSNEAIKKNNLKNRCEVYRTKYLDLESKVLLSRERYRGTAIGSDFSRFSVSRLNIDCSSPSITDSLVAIREIALVESETELINLNQRALREVICNPFELRLQKFASNYRKLILKYKGSRFEDSFPQKSLESLFSPCLLQPLTLSQLELMQLEFDQFLILLDIKRDVAERAYKAGKVTFNFNCKKGSIAKFFSNKTGECPSGWRRI
jgi:hypothetical protein